MRFFWLIRTIFLVIVLLISFAVVGLSANYIAKITSLSIPGVIDESTPPWAIVSIIAAGASVLLISPMVVIDFARRGAVTSWVATELIAFSILCVFWIVDAVISTVSLTNDLKFLARYGFPKSCGGLDTFITDIEAVALENPVQYGSLLDIDLDSLPTLCRSEEAVKGLAFAAWVILLVYTSTLVINALIARHRGHPVIWSSTVRDTQFLARQEGPDYRKEIDVPLAEMQQDYYASNQSLKPEAHGLTPAHD